MASRGDALMAPHRTADRDDVLHLPGWAMPSWLLFAPVKPGGQEADATWALMCTRAVMAGLVPAIHAFPAPGGRRGWPDQVRP